MNHQKSGNSLIGQSNSQVAVVNRGPEKQFGANGASDAEAYQNIINEITPPADKFGQILSHHSVTQCFTLEETKSVRARCMDRVR